MRRLIALCAAVSALSVSPAAPAWAGSPHFVGDVTATRSGDSVLVAGKEAGLGDESQVHIVASVTLQCVNRGDNHPRAGNKEDVAAEGTFPVQNGKADFSLTLTPTLSCSPPMTLQYSDVTVTDTSSGISTTAPLS